MKFDRQLSSTSAELSVKFQARIIWKLYNPHLQIPSFARPYYEMPYGPGASHLLIIDWPAGICCKILLPYLSFNNS